MQSENNISNRLLSVNFSFFFKIFMTFQIYFAEMFSVKNNEFTYANISFRDNLVFRANQK